MLLFHLTIMQKGNPLCTLMFIIDKQKRIHASTFTNIATSSNNIFYEYKVNRNNSLFGTYIVILLIED